jgi:hypothetical protein
LTTTSGKSKVGLGVMLGRGVMVGVKLDVGVKVKVGVALAVGVSVGVGVQVTVRVGVTVHEKAVAVSALAVSTAISAGDCKSDRLQAQVDTAKINMEIRIRFISMPLFG